MSTEDELARQDAMKFLDGNVPMALEEPDLKSPLQAENPGRTAYEELNPEGSWEALAPEEQALWAAGVKRQVVNELYERDAQAAAAVRQPAPRKRRRTKAEVEADKLAAAQEKERKKAERQQAAEAAKAQRAAERAAAKLAEKRVKIDAAEGGRVNLPAVVLRAAGPDGLPMVREVSDKDAWAVCEMYLDDLCLDTENSGYPLGHRLYELRTIQLGGEHAAVVFDAADPAQAQIAGLALTMAKKLRAHSAVADIVPCVAAGLIGWDEAWDKMQDSVLNAKLADPKMSGSDADALKELAADLLREYAVAPEAEKAKNALFREMGCLTKTELTTPPEKNGWHCVSRNSVVMVRYAGSDVLDLAAVLRILPPVPVSGAVMDREREFQAACAPVSYTGFALDADHINMKIAEEEAARDEAQRNVLILSDGKITNPKSPDVIKLLPEVIPGVQLGVNRKTKRPSANKGSLERVALTDDPLTHHLSKQILAYRHHDTTLTLLLYPLKILCDYGDGRMRPTVYTIQASTGRTSCVRPNGQQFSRQGGIRACVKAGQMYIALVDGQWQYFTEEGAPLDMLGISADFQGCEIRVAAGLSGDAALLEAETSPRCYACGNNPCTCERFHTGLHWMAAHEAFGRDATKEHRYWCKRCIFTKLFGGGPETAAEQVYAPVEPMRKIFSVFEGIASVYTEWDRWLRTCYQEGSMVWRDYATGQNYSQPIEGARRMIYRTYSGRNIYIANGAHAAGNGAIQGTARELLVDGVLAWRKTRWGRLPILPIHDQIFGFVPAQEAPYASGVLADCMQTRVLSSPGFEVYIGADIDEPFTSWPDSS